MYFGRDNCVRLGSNAHFSRAYAIDWAEKRVIVYRESAMQIIFYGAGKYAADNIERLKSEGIVPVCFADADESKQGTQICGYDVLSPENAILKYPDCVLQITLYRWNLRDTTEYLLGKGIPLDKIRYCEDVEYRKGCEHIRFSILDDRWSFCDVADEGEWTGSSGNMSDDFDKCLSDYAELAEKLKKQEPTICDKCPFLKYDIFDKATEIRNIAFVPGSQNDLCNFRCSYCVSAYNEQKKQNPPDILKILRAIKSHLPNEEIVVSFANGEMTIRRDFDDIMEFIDNQANWKMDIATNGSVYKPSLAKMLATGKVWKLTVSLDAGTAETFRKIKGVDALSKVVLNLEKYRESKGRIELKYIVLPAVNDAEPDLIGFADIAKRLNLPVVISKNSYPVRLSEMTDNERFAALKLAKLCADRGLEVIADVCHISDAEKSMLEIIGRS
jgi:wyosine [tRNA(Phe)-imidazoG37] synthetase (radical SAM superfamily)